METAEQICRVILPDGAEVSLQVSAGYTVGSVLERLSSILQLGPEFIDVVIANTNEVL